MISSEDENLLFLQPYLKLFMLESVWSPVLQTGFSFMTNLRALYNDCSDLVKNALQQAVTLSAVRNR